MGRPSTWWEVLREDVVQGNIGYRYKRRTSWRKKKIGKSFV
jgi:hypothetical protein